MPEAARALDGVPLTRLLQLASPALPIGAFAYSQGLETAVAFGWVDDEASASTWILGLLTSSVAMLDLPLLVRLHAAWTAGTPGEVRLWNDRLFAARGAAESRAEERRLGSALARVLARLNVSAAARWIDDPRVSYAGMFALACAAWDIPITPGAQAYAFAWCEAQVGAAARLVPLGQTSSQNILFEAGRLIPDAAARALALTDEDVGATAPAQALAAARHETLYSRLFRS